MLGAANMKLFMLLGLQMQPLKAPYASYYTDVHDCQLYVRDPQHAI